MTRRVVRVVSWLVTLGVTALVGAAVLVPRLAGATPYTVLTGSMAPSYPPGTLVIVKPVDIGDVRTGDVITFQLRSGEPTVATHRVVGIGWTGAGEKVLTTRGDANGAADTTPVREVQLRGEVWYSLPWVGHLNVLMSPDQHQWLVRIAAFSLFGYAALLLLRGSRPARDRSGAHAGAPPSSRPPGTRRRLVTPPGHVLARDLVDDTDRSAVGNDHEVSA